jgi:hypothetical protein
MSIGCGLWGGQRNTKHGKGATTVQTDAKESVRLHYDCGMETVSKGMQEMTWSGPL